MIGPKSDSDGLLFNAVRIETKNVAGASRHGTGFFFRFTTDSPGDFPVIVTNRHVCSLPRQNRRRTRRDCQVASAGKGDRARGHCLLET